MTIEAARLHLHLYRYKLGGLPYSDTGMDSNTGRHTNVTLLLAQRLRRWANINPTLVGRLVSGGRGHSLSSCSYMTTGDYRKRADPRK